MKKKPLFAAITDTHVTTENLGTVESVFDQLLVYCINNKIYNVVHCGDWFTDRSGQNLKCSLLVKRVIHQFTSRGIVIHTIPGNHDKPDLNAKESYLHLYEQEESNFRLFESAGRVSIGKATLYFLPYFKSSEIYLQQLLHCRQIMDQYGDEDNHHVLVTHSSINGVRNNDGTLVDDDLETDLFKVYDAVIVGHYHDAQFIKPNVHYIGSAYQANFGEKESDKGFTVVFNDLTMERIKTFFPTYKKMVIPANDKKWANAAMQDYEALVQAGLDMKLRIVFTGTQAEIDALDVTKFKEAGIDTRTENTTTAVLFENMDEADFAVMDRKSIIKGWAEYAKHVGMEKHYLTAGLKLLANLKN